MWAIVKATWILILIVIVIVIVNVSAVDHDGGDVAHGASCHVMYGYDCHHVENDDVLQHCLCRRYHDMLLRDPCMRYRGRHQCLRETRRRHRMEL